MNGLYIGMPWFNFQTLPAFPTGRWQGIHHGSDPTPFTAFIECPLKR